jgi:ADP-ribosylglycohydrolase
MNVTNPIDNANLSKIQNANNSNTNNAIPYVLNLTNDSDTTSQVVNQVIQAIGGGQSTSLEQVLNSVSKGNSSSSLEQVIDTASNALNNPTSKPTNGSGNRVTGLP